MMPYRVPHGGWYQLTWTYGDHDADLAVTGPATATWLEWDTEPAPGTHLAVRYPDSTVTPTSGEERT